MNKKRRILFTSLFALILVGICVVCFIFGRGHSIYLDNKDTEDGKYSAYDSIKVYYKGEKVSSVGKRERTQMYCTGQSLTLDFEYYVDSNSTKKEMTATIKIPYNLDGVILNLPAIIEGASEEEYLSEFVSKIDMSNVEEDITIDEFGLEASEE